MQKNVFADLALLLLFAVPTWAIDTMPDTSTYSRLFDPATIDTVNGVIKQINAFNIDDDIDSLGVQLVVDSKENLPPVLLAPHWFLQSRNMSFRSGDSVTVVGSRTVYFGQELIIAQEVWTKQKRYRFRTPEGLPLWAKENP